jgi:hypothetical protein
MDGPPPRGGGHQLIEKAKKIGAGVPMRRHPLNATRPDFQGGVQRQRSVPLVLEAMPFRAAG